MNLSDKHKAYLIEALSLLAIFCLMHFVGEIVLPFIFGIFIAYALNPLILKIQTKIKNRNLAISSLLFTVTLLVIGTIVFFGSHIVKDTKRFVSAVEVFTEDNKATINEIKQSTFSFFDQIYESDAIQNQIDNPDSLMASASEQDLASTIGSVYSFFETPEENKETPKSESWSPFGMLISTLIYAIFILYSFSYFEDKRIKYKGDKKPTKNRLAEIWNDFKIVFITFFKQRAKIILINIVILITAFTIMDLPGAIIIGIVTGVLSYASHFHFLSLPLAAIACWVLSVENGTNFFLYFGIILVVFALISVLEETLYFDKIMHSVNGMNPAIMILSFALWIYLFGGFKGTIIALPLTQLILIYMDRFILYSNEKRKALETNNTENK